MSNRKSLEDLVTRVENHLECWKQFSHYVGLARSKKFTAEDEAQFLEIKCVITQDLEQLLATVDWPSLSRDEIHQLLSSVPSLRSLSDANDTNSRAVEAQWHKLFINFQSLLGQLKVKRKEFEGRSILSSLFKKRSPVDK